LAPDQPTWYYWRESSLFIHVFLQPRASSDQIVGIHADCLKIRLTAPPLEGRANKQLLAFLAQVFRVPIKQVTLIKGEQSRKKWVKITNPVELGVLGEK
jgi:uncharacterized protein (TIGR00251 family)